MSTKPAIVLRAEAAEKALATAQAEIERLRDDFAMCDIALGAELRLRLAAERERDEARAALATAAARERELVAALEFYASPTSWWNQNVDDPLHWHQANLTGSVERLNARVGVMDDNPSLVRPQFVPDCGSVALAAIRSRGAKGGAASPDKDGGT